MPMWPLNLHWYAFVEMIEASFALICGHVCTCACLFVCQWKPSIETDLQISNFLCRRLCGLNRLKIVWNRICILAYGLCMRHDAFIPKCGFCAGCRWNALESNANNYNLAKSSCRKKQNGIKKKHQWERKMNDFVWGIDRCFVCSIVWRCFRLSCLLAALEFVCIYQTTSKNAISFDWFGPLNHVFLWPMILTCLHSILLYVLVKLFHLWAITDFVVLTRPL